MKVSVQKLERTPIGDQNRTKKKLKRKNSLLQMEKYPQGKISTVEILKKKIHGGNSKK